MHIRPGEGIIGLARGDARVEELCLDIVLGSLVSVMISKDMAARPFEEGQLRLARVLVRQRSQALLVGRQRGIRRVVGKIAQVSDEATFASFMARAKLSILARPPV